MSDALVVVVSRIDIHEAQLVANDLDIARGVGQLQHDAGGMPRLAPAIACVVNGPGSFHLEVGVHNGLVELHEEVLAIGPDALAHHAVEVHSGIAWHAHGAAGDFAAGHELQSVG